VDGPTQSSTPLDRRVGDPLVTESHGDREFFRCPNPPQTTTVVGVIKHTPFEENTMFELRALNPDAVAADLEYRRQQLVGRRVAYPQPRGRWWRRRSPGTD
jgi:hypothetical protein